jgi:tRNA(adenine34) deaminase
MPLDADSDERWMQEAIAEAMKAESTGEVPVGAVVVLDGRAVGRGANRNLLDSDPSAHAEIVAMREAGRRTGNHRLLEATLYCTVEPCAMCAGAMIHARLRRLVYGVDDPKAGAAGSVIDVLNHPALNHKMEVTRGVLAGRCGEMLQAFFRARRPAPEVSGG